MTTIPLAPFTTSMFITILNATIEIACVSAIFILIAIHECNRLLRGEHISIRRHMYIVRIVAVMAMVIFVILEVVISVNSGSSFRERTDSKRCISTGNFLPSGRNTSEAEAIAFRCVQIRKDIFSFRHGNYSLDNGQVQCEDDVIYKFQVGKQVALPVNGATIACLGEFCSLVHLEQNNKRVAFSEPLNVKNFPEGAEVATGFDEEDKAGFLVTDFENNITESSRTIAERVAEAYVAEVTDDLQLRRRTFQGSVEGKCDFVVRKDEVTEIAVWIVVVMSIVWTLSLLLFTITISQRKQVFYDIRSTWDWARKTNHLIDGTRDGDLFLRCVREEGVPRIYVVDGADEDNFNRQVSERGLVD